MSTVARFEDRSDTREHTRVTFRHPVSSDGFIDAVWWPRSRDLARELPGLLEGLWTSGREITRVNFALSAWDGAARTIHVGRRRIHLGGFTTSDPDTIRLSDAWGAERIDILVIAPDADQEVAERAMGVASEAGCNLRAADILARAAVRSDARS